MRFPIQLEQIEVHLIVTGDVWRQNCYLLKEISTGDLAIIDPGGDPELIGKEVDSQGGRLRHILLTHGHHDHVGAVAELAQRYGIPGRIHRSDQQLATRAPTYAFSFHRLRIDKPEPLSVFDGEPEFDFGTERIATKETPGHTSGGVSYLIPGCLFTGDTLLFRKTGRTDLPGADRLALQRSVSRLLQLPGDDMIFSGHGRPWNLAEARRWWAEQVAAEGCELERTGAL